MDKTLWLTFLGHPVCVELAGDYFGLGWRKSIYFYFYT